MTPIAEAASWANEVEIYKRFLLNPHPNILRCLMSSDRVAEGRLLLLTEYHPLGSLMEVLKGRIISLDEAEKIMCSMMAGVAFLHEADGKPAIAHRDFKSTNVLMKTDGTACVADFGLATAFEPNERIGDKHGQVRYYWLFFLEDGRKCLPFNAVGNQCRNLVVKITSCLL